MITEADTCRKYVLPKLYAAGWNDDQISEQKSFIDGRIIPVGIKGRQIYRWPTCETGVFAEWIYRYSFVTVKNLVTGS